MPHLKQVFRARNIWINETVKFDSNNSHLDSLMITEVEDLICIVEISDLPDIAQTDFNYQYEDWNDILVSGLESLSLESSQRHTTATASSEIREYDHQSSTSETTLSTPDSTPGDLICTLKVTVEPATESQITDLPQPDHADLSNNLINMSKQLIKKKPTQTVSADLQSEHILSEKQTRFQTDQQAVHAVTTNSNIEFNSDLLCQSFFIMISHVHRPCH